VPTAGSFRLQALDTARDVLYDLGPAPAPPPIPDADAPNGRCTWGDPVDGLTEMDPGIIRFTDATTLRARYGRDTCAKRAPKRTERARDLPKVTGSAKMITPQPPGRARADPTRPEKAAPAGSATTERAPAAVPGRGGGLVNAAGGRLVGAKGDSPF
jgi:hypothetical protein